jgi:hypothetical protein
MDYEMETGNISQYETSERVSTEKQKTNMETFYSKQISKDKSLKENINKKTHKKQQNDKLPTVLTNVYNRMQKKRSSSRVIKAMKKRYKKTDLISQLYKKLGKHRSISRDKAIPEVEEQVIEDRVGDVPMSTVK